MSLAYTILLYLAQASLVYGSKNAESKEFIHQKAKITSEKPEVLFSLCEIKAGHNFWQEFLRDAN